MTVDGRIISANETSQPIAAEMMHIIGQTLVSASGRGEKRLTSRCLSIVERGKSYREAISLPTYTTA